MKIKLIRFLSLIMACAMTITCFPATAFAQEEETAEISSEPSYDIDISETAEEEYTVGDIIASSPEELPEEDDLKDDLEDDALTEEIPESDILETDEIDLYSADDSEEIIKSGDWGNLQYKITTTSLIISGNGDMPELGLFDRAPWHGFGYYIETIVIENGVTSISRYSLDSCHSATILKIPKSVDLIQYDSYVEMKKLTAIEVDPNNAHFTSKDGLLYTKSMKQLIVCPKAKVISENFKFPTALRIIGEKAFAECNNITKITIPSTVDTIETRAFADCKNLKSCYISDGVTDLDTWIFNRCINLTDIRLPSDLTKIPSGLFDGCSSLEKVDIPKYLKNNWWMYVFSDCESLVSVNIPNGVTEINSGTFENCKSLKKIELPSSITYIGWGAFENCRNLESLFISNNVTSIAKNAFINCPKLVVTTYSGSFAEKYCKENEINYKLVNYAKPTVPKNVKIRSVSYNSITLSWDSSVDADGYQVYCSTSPDGPFTRIKTTQENTYTHSGLGNQAKRYYKVEAYKKYNGVNNFSSMSAVVSGTAVMDRPTGVKAASVNYAYNSITWDKVSGASGYQICYATEKDGTYSIFATVSAGTNSYTHKNLKTGQSYYYKVRAYMTVNGSTYNSFYSSIVTAKPKPSTPTSIKAASQTYNSIKISWTSVSYATGYQVYCSTSENGSYTLLTTTSADTKAFTHNKLDYRQTYYYKVRTMQNVNGIKYYSAYTTTVSALTQLSRTTNLTIVKAGTNSCKLSWDQVNGATGYQIYSAAAESGPYELVATTTSREFIHEDLLSETTYYKVRAYKSINGEKTYGNLSVIVSYKKQ